MSTLSEVLKSLRSDLEEKQGETLWLVGSHGVAT